MRSGSVTGGLVCSSSSRGFLLFLGVAMVVFLNVVVVQQARTRSCRFWASFISRFFSVDFKSGVFARIAVFTSLSWFSRYLLEISPE